MKNNNEDGKSIWYPIIALGIVLGTMILLFGAYKGRQYLNHRQLIKNEEAYKKANDVTAKQHKKFINQVGAPAVEQYKKNKQVLPSIVIAQAILESNWGKSKLYTKANNPFGIKGTYQGQSISYETGEYINKKRVTQIGQFRKYPDLQAAIEDHNQALFDRFLKKSGITSYQEEARLLQKNTYATDPQYTKKLVATIKAHDLEKFDKKALNQ